MKAGLKMFSASLILATAHAMAADTRLGKPDAAPVAIERVSQEKDLQARAASHPVRAENRLAYAAFTQAEEGLDLSARSAESTVRLYPVASAEGAGGARAASSAHAEHGAPARGAAPEPGSWAMILAGLLSVGAIARRRMSV